MQLANTEFFDDERRIVPTIGSGRSVSEPSIGNEAKAPELSQFGYSYPKKKERSKTKHKFILELPQSRLATVLKVK